MASINTLRLLLTFDCNLKCSYCCNEIPEVRNGIKSIKFEEIDWGKYDNICISGGEPFLILSTLVKTLFTIKRNNSFANVYIYTNGLKCEEGGLETISKLFEQIKGFNIGLHYPKTFDNLIKKHSNNKLVRFHAEDIYKDELLNKYSDVRFQFWKRNNCEMENEEIFILNYVKN